MSSFGQAHSALSESFSSPSGQSYPVARPRPADEHAERSSKRQRVRKACDICRKRKISCSGDEPCNRCREDGHLCEYNGEDRRTNRKQRFQQLSGGHDSTAQRVDAATSWMSNSMNSVLRPHASTDHGNSDHVDSRGSASISANISRDSMETGMIYDDDQQHTGPTSGLAFLQQAVHRLRQKEGPERLSNNEPHAPKSASIFTSGDMPTPATMTAEFEMPDKESSARMLSRYFDFATPTYRFFHRPTVEIWAKLLISCPSDSPCNSKSLTTAQEAAVYLIWAQALEYHAAENRNPLKSNVYFEKARVLLDNEPGPPRLESIQARLASCLYLLSTSRINECWYRFGMTTLIVVALGLHRKKIAQSPKVGLIELECHKRVFWSAYILDRYLSVMKGRPRIFRDEDIDQEYPANVSDDDMVNTDKEMLRLLPPHGLLEATISHAKLTSIMGQATDLLYPLQPLPANELLIHTEAMTKSLELWKENLPSFLKPSQRTLTGHRIFERQNTVLKLSYAHVRILICRQFLLRDFATLGRSKPPDSANQAYLDDCMIATYTILDTVDAFVSQENLIHGFWFTQYIALCAISTFYIYVIHYSLNSSHIISISGKNYFEIAERCQKFLASLATEGSPSKRYHFLLTQLRQKASLSSLQVRLSGAHHTQAGLSGGESSQYDVVQDEVQLSSNAIQGLATVQNGGLLRDQNIDVTRQESMLQNLGGNTGATEYPSPDQVSTMEFDALNLTWEFFDQLALPEQFAFNDSYVW